MAVGKFSRTAAAGGATKKRSRYAGIHAAQPLTPMPCAGVYRVRVLACEEGHNPGKGTDSFKAQLEICALDATNKQHAVGDSVAFIQLLSGPAGAAGLSRTKAFVMAASGYDDEAAYDEFDPEGMFIDACVGGSNEYAARGETIVGRLVDVEVSRGRATLDGEDYYREFAWGVVPDAEQSS